MRTAATEMLDIEFPIFAFSHCRDVVAAVSKAGGLGVLGDDVHPPFARLTGIRQGHGQIRQPLDMLLKLRLAQECPDRSKPTTRAARQPGPFRGGSGLFDCLVGLLTLADFL